MATTATLLVIFLPTTVSFVLAGVMCLLPIIPMFRRPAFLIGIGALCLYLAVGAGYRMVKQKPVEATIGQKDHVVGIIKSRWGTGRYYELKITQSDRLPVGSRILLYCADLNAPSVGNTVESDVQIEALYPSQKSARADGIFAIAFSENGEATIVSAEERESALDNLRSRLADSVRHVLSEEEGSLIIAVCLGDKRSLSDKTVEDFRACGLPHLMVVSGLHLSMVAAGLALLWKALKIHRRYAAVLTAVGIVLFTVLVGWTPSVIRAGIMCLLLLLGRVIHRQADGLNSLGLALSVLLLENPYAVTDVGLVLSFGAAFGVLWLSPRLQKDDRRPYYQRTVTWRDTCRQALAVTVGATVPLLALLAYWFGSVSLISPLSNLLAVAPAGWMLILGCLAMVVGCVPFLSFLQNGLLFLAGWIARYLIRLASFLASLPFASVSVTKTWVLVWLVGCTGLILLCAYFRSAKAMRRAVIFSAGLLVTVQILTAFLSTGTVTVIGVCADHPTAVIRYHGQVYVIAEQETDLIKAKSVLKSCGMEQVAVLFTNDESTTDEPYRVDFVRQFSTQSVVYATENRQATTPDEGLQIQREQSGIWKISCGVSTWLLLPSRTSYANAVPSCDGAFLYGAEKQKWQAVALPKMSILIQDRPMAVINRMEKEWHVAYGIV